MNKIRLSIVISIAVVLVFVLILSSFFMNPQTSNIQTPTPTAKPITNVHITNFHFTNFFSAEGMSWNCGFVIEVTNNETDAIDNLTLAFSTTSPYNISRTIRFYNNTSLLNHQLFMTMGEPSLLGPVRQSEAKLLYGAIEDNFDDYSKIRGYTVVATLRIGNTVLDQAVIDIP